MDVVQHEQGWGLFIIFFGAISQGLYMLPMSKMQWKWENSWLIFSAFGLLVFPWCLVFATVPHALDILQLADSNSILLCIVFGILWGIGNVLFGIGITIVGNAITFAVVLGLTASIGSLVPLLILHSSSTHIKEIVLDFFALGVCILGLCFIALAGHLKQKETIEHVDVIRNYRYSLLESDEYNHEEVKRDFLVPNNMISNNNNNNNNTNTNTNNNRKNNLNDLNNHTDNNHTDSNDTNYCNPSNINFNNDLNDVENEKSDDSDNLENNDNENSNWRSRLVTLVIKSPRIIRTIGSPKTPPTIDLRRSPKCSPLTLGTAKTNEIVHSFNTGLLICVCSGIFSAMLNFPGNFCGDISSRALEKYHVSEVASGNLIWAVATTAGAIPNILYSCYLLSKNNTWRNYYYLDSKKWKMHLCWLFLMCGLWFSSIILFGIGSNLMGTLGKVVGWPIFLNLSIIVANVAGFFAGEWKDASSETVIKMNTGLLFLVMSIILLGIAAKR